MATDVSVTDPALSIICHIIRIVQRRGSFTVVQSTTAKRKKLCQSCRRQDLSATPALAQPISTPVTHPPQSAPAPHSLLCHARLSSTPLNNFPVPILNFRPVQSLLRLLCSTCVCPSQISAQIKKTFLEHSRLKGRFSFQH